MDEKFLQYIWRSQAFHGVNLRTAKGKEVNIFSPGTQNSDAGPDFLNSKLAINNILWFGNVEVHVNSSDWYLHGHQHDPAYENVILHIVWHHNKEITRSDGTEVDTLEISRFVTSNIVDKYKSFFQEKIQIPCSKSIENIPDIKKHDLVNKMFYNRIERKNNFIQELLTDCRGDWQELTYRLLAFNLGFKVNSQPMLTLASKIPVLKVCKIKNRLIDLEAVFFGVSRLLPSESENSYVRELISSWKYLSIREQFIGQEMNICEWNFFRLRPSNSPTVRIAQLVMLLHKYESLFDIFLYLDFDEIVDMLRLSPSEFWQHHYNFSSLSSAKISRLGKQSVLNILINTVAPILIAYGKMKNVDSFVDKAISLLELIEPENNSITRLMAKNGFVSTNALESQGVIELYNSNCLKKKCNTCSIGSFIIANS